ncbi:MAG: hypothetical protein J5I94_27000, partial [Phaeodactylibacter sp.]|nr:hypothetical protein [Phaeodactylibacter sp.]
MILKADPNKVLRFIVENFELVRSLYLAQLEGNVISREQFNALTKHTGDISINRLFEYKLLTEQYDDIRLNEPVRAFLAFLISEFKPLLPSELEKYRTSFSELFTAVQEIPEEGEQPILLEQLEALYDEVQRFLENVENNTGQLLRETQHLKANKDKMEYGERIRRARHLIEYYIAPLNSILDLQHSESIASLLGQISAYANRERLVHGYQLARDRFGQLHELLRGGNERILRQSRILSRELLPLIERLQTESEILSGWLFFLERPFRHDVPSFTTRSYRNFFGSSMGANVALFMEQFVQRAEAVILQEEEIAAVDRHEVLFDRQLYVESLREQLPVGDFFGWCRERLYQNEQLPSTERFLKICSIVFEDSEQYEAEFTGRRIEIELEDFVF